MKTDDYFTVKSILNSPYKLLKFNFNKITNSYNFFINFNSQRKQKIKIDSTKNVFYKEKTKLYNIIFFFFFIINNIFSTINFKLLFTLTIKINKKIIRISYFIKIKF